MTSRKLGPPAVWFRSAHVLNHVPTSRSSKYAGRTRQPCPASHATTCAWPSCAAAETEESSSSTGELGRPPRKLRGTTVRRLKSTGGSFQIGRGRYSAATGSSSGSGGPDRSRMTRPRSSAWRVTTPGWQMRQTAPWKFPRCDPVLAMRPPVGLWPKSPQKRAGILVEPPMSAVMPTGAPSAATPAAVPPLEPPQVLERSKGLELRP
mmetsp:Transcript_97625/g.315201  ORF Transcript_97625/g.315201 Transcript_97625/m.315201 type:complete len:207 (-) Transcript_97625:507-1127(-)